MNLFSFIFCCTLLRMCFSSQEKNPPLLLLLNICKLSYFISYRNLNLTWWPHVYLILFKKKNLPNTKHTQKNLYFTLIFNDPLEGLVHVRVKRAHKKKLLAKLTKTQSKSQVGWLPSLRVRGPYVDTIFNSTSIFEW
jgi:hypothetical protein